MANNAPPQQKLRNPAPAKLNQNGRLTSPADVDTCNLKSKLNNCKGKPISSAIHAGHSMRNSNPPFSSSSSKFKKPPPGPIAYGISKWHDPDPEQPVVDVTNDAEFLGSLGTKPTPSTTLRNPSHTPERDPPLRPLPRESSSSPLGKAKNHRNKKLGSNSTLEEVVREMFPPRTNPRASSMEKSDVDMREPLNRDHASGEHKYDEIKLCSSECSECFVFPRQILEVSGGFLERMKDSGFDGVITIQEGENAMALLGGWMCRNLDFEINVDNCKSLLRLASMYDIPRLRKDVLSHLIHLPLHPFDGYNYGKLYAMAPLSRLNFDHVLEHFGEYVTTHFRELIVECPDEGVELVKQYIQMQSASDDGTRNNLSGSNRFRKWLVEETPVR